MVLMTAQTRHRIQKFLSYYIPFRKIFFLDMFFAVLSAGAALLFPLVSGYITGEVLALPEQGNTSRLFQAGLLLFILMVVQVVSNITYAHWGHAMGAKMEGRMREDLLAHFESQSYDFFAKNSVGKLMTLLSNDLTNMTELFHHGPEDLVMTAIKFIGAFVILFHIDVPLTLLVFSVFPLLCAAALWTNKAMVKGLLTSKRDLEEMNGQLEDTLAGIRTVKAFGNEELEQAKFRVKNRRYVDSQCYFYKVEAYFYELVGAYPQFLTMLVVLFGALFLGKTMEVSVLVTFLLYVGCLQEPVRILINFMSLYAKGKASFLRFMQMLEQKPSISPVSSPQTLEHVRGEILLDKVSFRYPDGTENVLEQVDLQIHPGERVAIVGSSGIGKSTLTYLIARFYDVQEGCIQIDGVDIRKLSPSSLREHIGIVQQEVYLFAGTIRENICYGCPQTTEDQMIQAAKMAGAHDFISQLDQGYDTVVGTKGITLSGGQRQRISLARVFLKNPPILILDEATSALDSENEYRIQSALEQLMEGRTSIVIAHRLSTIQNAHRILVLKDRQIAEEGTHQELLAKGGEYARLYFQSALSSKGEPFHTSSLPIV